jgi:hypothetical protein
MLWTVLFGLYLGSLCCVIWIVLLNYVIWICFIHTMLLDTLCCVHYHMDYTI